MLEKKLVFITTPIAYPWDEGSKNFTLYLAKKIRIPNLTVYILTTKNKINSLPEHVKQITLYSNPQSTPKLTFKAKLKLFLFLLKTDADIVHLIFAVTPLTSILLRLLFLIKHLKTVQTIVTLDIKSSFLLKVALYGSRITCLSKSTAERINKLGSFQVHTIPPAVDTKKFTPLIKKKTIAFLGELNRLKSYEIVSRLIPLLADSFPDYTIILGFRLGITHQEEYVLREKLQKEIKNLKINVVWHDVIDKMPEFLGETKLVIYPAMTMQGKFDLPLVLIEALACGTPVAISNIAPLTELSAYKGVGTPAENTASSFMKTVRDILSEKSYNVYSQAARKTAANYFSIDRAVRQYEKIYEELTS